MNEARSKLGRKIAYSIALLLLIAGFMFLPAFYKNRNKCREAEKALPITLNVDLSKPGKYSGLIKQTATFTCGEIMVFVTGKPFNSYEAASKALKGIKGTLEIKDQLKFDFNEDSFASFSDNSQPNCFFPCLRFRPFTKGEFPLTLEIREGASGLSGSHQKLIAKYELCGIEKLPGFLSLFFGIICWIIAGIIALITFVVARSNDRKTEQSA